MKTDEYKELLKGKNVLDHTTLDVTLKELTAKNEYQLIGEIQRIFKANKIDKPTLHSTPEDNSTNYYKIDLSTDDIDKLANLFFELEASFIGEDGDTTPTASFYGSMADRWQNINEKNID
jgi:hypothetical protein